MPRFKVTFTAKFESYVDADNSDDAISEAHIPESDSTTYLYDSFEVQEVEQVAREPDKDKDTWVSGMPLRPIKRWAHLEAEDECPNCKCGTLEQGEGELCCRGECGTIFPTE
jgi:hypothetical protein